MSVETEVKFLRRLKEYAQVEEQYYYCRLYHPRGLAIIVPGFTYQGEAGVVSGFTTKEGLFEHLYSERDTFETTTKVVVKLPSYLRCEAPKQAVRLLHEFIVHAIIPKIEYLNWKKDNGY